jgi:hypothetical protein
MNNGNTIEFGQRCEWNVDDPTRRNALTIGFATSAHFLLANKVLDFIEVLSKAVAIEELDKYSTVCTYFLRIRCFKAELVQHRTVIAHF